MANWCSYCMRITGGETECKEFYAILKSEKTRHFDRVYEADVLREGNHNGIHFVEISGYCAWSVCNSMDNDDGLTTLQAESARLELMIEVYSTEPSNQIAEHIWYLNGQCIEHECVDYTEFYWDKCEYPTIEELNAHYGTTYSKDDFDMDGYHIEGGFGKWIFWKRG